MSTIYPCRHGFAGRCETCHPRSPVEVAFSQDRMDGPDLVALIRQAEWSNYNTGAPRCPWCGCDKRRGHAPDCPVLPVLYPDVREQRAPEEKA